MINDRVFMNVIYYSQAASSTQALACVPVLRVGHPGIHRRKQPTHPQGKVPAEAHRERAQKVRNILYSTVRVNLNIPESRMR